MIGIDIDIFCYFVHQFCITTKYLYLWLHMPITFSPFYHDKYKTQTHSSELLICNRHFPQLKLFSSHPAFPVILVLLAGCNS
jgi:hypothetical protein